MYSFKVTDKDVRLIEELYHEWDVPTDVSTRQVQLWNRGLITLEEFAVEVEVDDATIWAAVEACGGGVTITEVK